ncbi:hypothetical protein ABID56_001401 [Alkalibacillus flavidus]|uniref:Uncharacterized protein n=1 Tax=Alkalibacillus flavidus TaxID=546021 RepID=A0ABV2KXM6_9BACI
MDGWVTLPRRIVKKEVWADPMAFRLYMLLLTQARYSDVTYCGRTLERGQYLRSYTKLQEDLRYKDGRQWKDVPKAKIHRTVKRLVEWNLITVEVTQDGTLFTVIDYEGCQKRNVKQKRNTSETVVKPKESRWNHRLNQNQSPYGF